MPSTSKETTMSWLISILIPDWEIQMLNARADGFLAHERLVMDRIRGKYPSIQEQLITDLLA